MELERLYRVKVGNPQLCNNVTIKKQDDIAKEIGVSRQQLIRYKKLLDLIPELQDLVEQEKLSAATAYLVYAKLSPEEQKKMLDKLGADKISEMPRSQAIQEVQELIDEIHSLKIRERKWYEKYQQEKKKKPEVKTVTVTEVKEVMPESLLLVMK